PGWPCGGSDVAAPGRLPAGGLAATIRTVQLPQPARCLAMPAYTNRCFAALLALPLVFAPPRAAGPPAAKGALPGVETDVPYAAGGDQQKLALSLPGKRGFATVVFTYGGGWHTGGRKSVTPVGKKLQALGYGCALLSHRLSPKDRFPAQAEDVAAGFAWV